MDIVLKKLGERIRELRKWRGLSQEKLAAKAGLHFTYIGDIERGKRNVAIENVSKIAKALEIELADLFKSDEAIEKKMRVDDIAKLLKDRRPKELKLAERVLKSIFEE